MYYIISFLQRIVNALDLLFGNTLQVLPALFPLLRMMFHQCTAYRQELILFSLAQVVIGGLCERRLCTILGRLAAFKDSRKIKLWSR